LAADADHGAETLFNLGWDGLLIAFSFAGQSL
jgi:hypothetical protein